MDHLRVSDAERLRVVAALERHTAAGRLSLDEFSGRVTQAFEAATRQDLDLVTSDLPAEPASAAESRQLMVAFLLAMLTLAMLALILILGR